MDNRKEFYERYITTSFYGEFEMSFPKVEQFKHDMGTLFPTDKNAKCLDIGVGRGEMLFLWRQLGYPRCEGIDISREVVDFCTRMFGEGIVMHIDDTAEYLAVKKKSYDVITMIDVLEHIPRDDVLRVMTKVHEALCDGGVLIIQTPNMNSLFPSIHRYNDLTHEVGYQEHSLEQLMKWAGFSSFQFFGSYLPPKSLKGRTRLVLQRLLCATVRLLRRIDTSEREFKVMTPNIICQARG